MTRLDCAVTRTRLRTAARDRQLWAAGRRVTGHRPGSGHCEDITSDNKIIRGGVMRDREERLTTCHQRADTSRDIKEDSESELTCDRVPAPDPCWARSGAREQNIQYHFI